MTGLRTSAAALLGTAALALALPTTPAYGAHSIDGDKSACFEPSSVGAGARDGKGRPADTREVTVRQQRAIDARTARILDRQGATPQATATLAPNIPVYVHVMADKNGVGNVSDAQIANQISVLNTTYGGQELSGVASNTGFTFYLAGTDRYYNSTWHADRQSTTYRSKTRLGGANALNIWLVDFSYLGIATFPWDYAKSPSIDGIRVHYQSLPGGSYTNYNYGETATHEAGHWLGLYHTFQGGCAEPNDSVSDTPAQSSSTSGCPEGRDSCALPGLDPIHNYMDYSYDTCYNQFTGGQTSRMQQMWAAYRG